jgi:hypothetical protein
MAHRSIGRALFTVEEPSDRHDCAGRREAGKFAVPCGARGLAPMKVVPLSQAKAKLSRYPQLCHDEPVVVTVNGRPFFNWSR